ncbi:MAG: tail fiber domain-containing protein [Candidatus Omnitrophica bacterium]|nr:tail fiber domain-containing protein [Candidatus Omnitrophota bacterium]
MCFRQNAIVRLIVPVVLNLIAFLSVVVPAFAGQVVLSTKFPARTGIYHNVTVTGNTGVGTITPAESLDVYGKIGVNEKPMLFIRGTTSLVVGSENNQGSFATDFNTFVGSDAGVNTRKWAAVATSEYNTAVGYQALITNSIGSFNTAVGTSALFSNDTGGYNTALGSSALYSNNFGAYNTALGYWTLNRNVGNFNTAVGPAALSTNTGGINNTAFGAYAAAQLTNNSNNNTAIGYQSLVALTAGNNNAAIGSEAGGKLESGNGNIFIGAKAGMNITSGDTNIMIGYNVSALNSTGSGQLVIGNLIFGADIYNPVGGCIAIGMLPSTTCNDASGNFYKLEVNGIMRGTWILYSSDRRLKENILPVAGALGKVLALNGVHYNLKGDPRPKIGVVAQDAALVLPEVVSSDGKGIMAVSYGNVAALLIESVKEEQAKIREIDALIASQQQQIDALREELK